MENIDYLDRQAQDVAARALAEYCEQPALCLTIAQAARLWQVDVAVAAEVLDALTRSGYLCLIGTQFRKHPGELVPAAA
jgi:hypothetical protein